MFLEHGRHNNLVTTGRRHRQPPLNLRAAQAQFNAWKKESGLPIAHISRICALSIGENYAAEKLASMVGGEEYYLSPQEALEFKMIDEIKPLRIRAVADAAAPAPRHRAAEPVH